MNCPVGPLKLTCTRIANATTTSTYLQLIGPSLLRKAKAEKEKIKPFVATMMMNRNPDKVACYNPTFP